MALTLTPGMGPTRIGKAVKALGAAERLFEISLTELEATGMPAQSAQFIFEGKARAAAQEEIHRVAEAGGSILTPPSYSQARAQSGDMSGTAAARQLLSQSTISKPVMT